MTEKTLPLPLRERKEVRGNVKRARQLRHTQTDAERKLWASLRDRKIYGAKFRRQHPIGPFVADFCCLECRLIIELDGGHHADQIKKDERRTTFLKERGYQVIRFWDHDVLQHTREVVETIGIALKSSPHPQPSPARGEGAPINN